ncbi:hypothetical protein DHEL01_v211662 [Diaporthe helianthi]|uniref:Uncharacterized protein n=1 Tax=Diaporthe helianthi TaxID=158607 RepID=A0A2P5HI77_DIAHE|nr:hypothetical protein DHEL01_v211662 [Diaporthe helianthi]
MSWLEILNYSDPEKNTAEHSSKLRTTDMFMSFLKRKTPFAPRELSGDVKLQDGIRLILQTRAEDAEAFAPGVISLEKTSYEALLNEFHLSFRCLDSSSAVGPCFWWAHIGGHLELIFRKSDVEWKGNSRGWEMMLSYSFDTGMTSGYVKAMEKMNFNAVLDDLVLCGKPVSHPFLLVVLTLCNELSSKNDMEQRAQRRELRKLDDTLTARYTMAPAPHYGPETDPELDNLSKMIAVCQSKVLQKRPQAWQNVVDNVRKAATHFWDHIPPEDRSVELIFVLWYTFDRRARKKRSSDTEDGQHEANEMSKIEARIMKQIRRRTGIKVADTFPGAGNPPGQA